MADVKEPKGEKADEAGSHGAVELARKALNELVLREPERHPLVVALVSPLGTPLDQVVDGLRDSFSRFDYNVEVVHLSSLLDDLTYRPWGELPTRGERDYYERRMDAGD